MNNDIVTGTPKKRSALLSSWKRLRRYPTAIFGFTVFGFFLLMALIGPMITPYNYDALNVQNAIQAPSAAHWLGTDNFGRDVFSRILAGSRDVYMTAGFATLVAAFFGLCLGLFSGYKGGFADEIIMRIIDVIIAIPSLLLAMVVIFSLGPSRLNLILVIGFLYIPMVSRVVRSVVLDVKTRQFVEAAKLRGESLFYILSREILPNVLPHLAVETTMRFSYAIFTVASLGFLGMGIQPPSPDWGFMVSDARVWYELAPWTMLAPAGTIALLVVGVGFMSDGLSKLLLPGGVADGK